MDFLQIAQYITEMLKRNDKILSVGDVVSFGERNPGAEAVIVTKNGSVLRVTVKQISGSKVASPKK
jgi:hypothetical protein